MSGGPLYWRDEVTGRLAAVIARYLREEPLSAADLQVMRVYLIQWIDAPVWDSNPHLSAEGRLYLTELRQKARNLNTYREVEEWLDAATENGMDPI